MKNKYYIKLFQKMCLKDGGDNVQIRVTILRCFTSWITVRAIPLQTIPTSEVVTYVFQVSIYNI